MAHLTSEAHRLLARQHGIASIGELIASGVPLHDIRRIERAGGLELVLSGAYRTPSVPFDEVARCAAVCVAHPELTIAGPTAARLWGFRRVSNLDRRIHVIGPPASNPTIAAWVVPYRTAAIHERDIVCRRDGIRLTSRPRTVFDLARLVDATTLRSLIEQAMADGPHTNQDMVDVAADWQSPRRRWARTYLAQAVRRLPGGPAESHHELVLAEALVEHGVTGLVRQFTIELPGYGRARFDLAVPELRWAIEVDAHPSHRDPVGVAQDARRDECANASGWLVTRVPECGFGPRLVVTVADIGRIHAARRASLR
jgi:very-short-patch-repair endonuclease